MEGEKLSDPPNNGGNRDISLFGYVRISLRIFVRPISEELHAHTCPYIFFSLRFPYVNLRIYKNRVSVFIEKTIDNYDFFYCNKLEQKPPFVTRC